MLRSILMGLVAGQRAMTPLCALAGAARRGTLRHANPQARWLASPLIAAGSVVLAAAEMAGDKMTSAPDRTAFPGLLARTITGGFAGATLAARKRQLAGAAVGIAAAIGSAHGGLALRRWAMRRWGRTTTGFAEEAIVLAAANVIANARPPRR